MTSGTKLHDLFRRAASHVAKGVGTPWAFVGAFAVVLVWAVSGPVFKYSDTWQLVINTGTTIVTFLMVFLIQNTQNRDSHAIHLKLDELIRVNRAARDRLIQSEELDEHDLDELQGEFDRIANERVAQKKRASRPSGQVASRSSSTTGPRSERTT